MKKLITLTMMMLTLCIQQNHAMGGFRQASNRLTPYIENFGRQAGQRYDALAAAARRYARPTAIGAAGLGGLGGAQYLYNNPQIVQNAQQAMTPPELMTQERKNYMYNMLPSRNRFSNMIPTTDRLGELYNNALQNENVQRTREAINRMYNEALQSEMARRLRNYWTPQGE